MNKSRVIIETDPNLRKDLEFILKERGITLTEWFSEKIAEESAQPELLQVESSPRVDYGQPKQLFKSIKSVDWSFTDENTGHSTHSIHPYPAKFIPQIPNKLIQLLSNKGDRIWDPFGGSGTTALEALRLGRDALSTDINPIATLVGRAKTCSLSQKDEEELERFINRLDLLCSNEDNLKRAIKESLRQNKNSIPDIPNIEKWFSIVAVEELAFIKSEIDKLVGDSARTLSLATFSKIITRVSNQDSETRYVSKPKNIERSYVIKAFKSELKSICNKAKLLTKSLQFRSAEFSTINLLTENSVEPDSIDLVVTSPPYPNATDYHLYHRFRIYWLGYKPQKMAESEIGSHLRHQRNEFGIQEYLVEMRTCLEKIYQSLKPGRYAVMVIGDSVFQKKEYKTAELVSKEAEKAGFQTVGIVKRPVHASKRSFIGAARRLREEKILVLWKPTKQQDLKLYEPPYKLWEYEKRIREIENKVLLSEKLADPINVRRLTFTHHYQFGEGPKQPTWQAVVENGDAVSPSARKDPKYVTHGLHAYKGKFYPQLAKSLINISGLSPGDHIFDPFCGSGTVLLESYLNGYQGAGMDLNPLAIKIAEVKIGILKTDPKILDATISSFLNQIESRTFNDKKLAVYGENIDEVLSWFARPVAVKLAHILILIREVPDQSIREFLEVCVSSIIREVSQQEPKDLRIRRRSTPLSDADVFGIFKAKVLEQHERILRFHSHAHRAPAPFGKTAAHLLDSRESGSYKTAGIKENSIDAIVTSPPYATALPYIDTDRLSILMLLGLKSNKRSSIEESLIGAREIRVSERKVFEEQIESLNFSDIGSEYAQKVIKEIHTLNSNHDVGFRRKNMGSLLYRYFSDMSRTMSNLDRILKPGGQAFFVIGNNKTQAGNKDIIIDSAKFLLETGEKMGWKTKKVIPITVTQENRLHNKNGITENDIIWMQK